MEAECDLPATDLRRWRLKSSQSEGVHNWLYLGEEEEARSLPQTFAEKYFLGLPTVSDLPPPPKLDSGRVGKSCL